MELEDALDPTQWCPHCKSRLAVTHTYAVPGGRTQNRVCEGCSVSFTATISTSLEENTGRGKGAWAVAQEIRRRIQC